MKSYIKRNETHFLIYQILHQTQLKMLDLSQRDHDTLKPTALDELQPNGTHLYTTLKMPLPTQHQTLVFLGMAFGRVSRTHNLMVTGHNPRP